jgi:hypothetical protein
MPKDLVVNLMVAGSRDAAASYAISIAKTFDAHLAGIAFAYEPVLPAIVGGGIPESVIEEQREENEKAAKAAVAQFEAAAKDVKHETRMVAASLAGAADTFGEIARLYDLAIVGQSERDRVGPEELIVEGALFGAERMVMLGADLVLPTSLVKDRRLDYVALGHIHKPQDLNEGYHPPVIYPGSIERVDFGEAMDDKFFVIADVGRGATQVQWRKIDGTRPFIERRTIIVSTENVTEHLIRTLPTPDRMTEAIVKLAQTPRIREKLSEEGRKRSREFTAARLPTRASRRSTRVTAAAGRSCRQPSSA